ERPPRFGGLDGRDAGGEPGLKLGLGEGLARPRTRPADGERLVETVRPVLVRRERSGREAACPALETLAGVAALTAPAGGDDLDEVGGGKRGGRGGRLGGKGADGGAEDRPRTLREVTVKDLASGEERPFSRRLDHAVADLVPAHEALQSP